MAKFVWMFAAGGCGALARYWLGAVVQRLTSSTFPFGTIVVNIVGCIVFGVFWSLGERLIISRETRFLILTGFVGAFTTFSTFAFETSELLRDAEWRDATINIVAHQFLGIAGILAGIACGRLL